MKKFVLTLTAAVFAAAVMGFWAEAGKASSSRRDDRDPELAATIRRLTDRSTAGLTEKKAARGGVSVDLQGRFQDLALVRLDPEGDPAVECVSSIDEANRFFGRDLETGEVFSASPVETEEYLRTKHAAPTDMTIEEFLRYKEMIRRAAPRLRGSNAGASSTDSSVPGTSNSI